MVFKAPEKYGPGEIDRTIEGLGAQLNGGTSKDWVHFYTTVASEHLPTALDAVADAVMNARFRPEDIEKERRVIVDEIARTESNPSRHALDLLSGLAFTVHPYRFPATGTRESIAQLTREELLSYYSARYIPANICVVIAGDVSRTDAVALVKSAFRGFGRDRDPTVSGSAKVPAVPKEPLQPGPRSGHLQLGTKQSYIAVGFHVPGVAEFKAACALDVVLAALGDTHRGRVSAALARAGIRFSKVSTDFVTQRDPTTFSVLAAVEPEDADKVLPVVLSEFRKLAKYQLTSHEFADAKRLVEGSHLFEQETFAGQARALGFYESIGSYEMALRYPETVRAVTADDVMNMASKYFATNAYTLVILGPEQVHK